MAAEEVQEKQFKSCYPGKDLTDHSSILPLHGLRQQQDLNSWSLSWVIGISKPIIRQC